MKFNKITYNISFAILAITALYTLIYSGLTGILLCSSVALIVAAFLDQFEIIVAISVIFAIFYTHFLKNFIKRFEPFEPTQNDTQVGQPEQTQQTEQKKPQVSGFMSSFSEGFADKKPVASKSASSDTQPAIPPEEVTAFTDANTKPVKEGYTKSKKSKNETFKDSVTSKDAVTSNAATSKEEFQSATNELFKLGKMPSEHKDGPMLDAGSTLLKAMGSFKPEQINAMSSDTKQLLETQKSLMGMLNQMRPVLADGKELLQTFSGMFGNGGLNMGGLGM
jgi:hypothetical protein